MSPWAWDRAVHNLQTGEPRPLRSFYRADDTTPCSAGGPVALGRWCRQTAGCPQRPARSVPSRHNFGRAGRPTEPLMEFDTWRRSGLQLFKRATAGVAASAAEMDCLPSRLAEASSGVAS